MKMISRRDFMKASAVVGAAGVLTACGGSSSSTAASSTAASSAAASAAASGAATGSANVGVCIYQFADNFMTLYRTDLEEYLKDKGYSVTIVDGKNDQNTQTCLLYTSGPHRRRPPAQPRRTLCAQRHGTP